VYASSVNPFDIKFSQGMMPDVKLPITLGNDVAGVVAEIGEGVENFSVGNKVYGSANALSGATGAFAEFAVIPTEMITKMPRSGFSASRTNLATSKNIDFNQAAAVVLTGVSAVQALLEHLKLQANQKILIHGGAGGIGTIAIQIAKHIGAYVATTATGEGINYVEKLGADQVIDYKNHSSAGGFDEILSDFDAVFDTVGGETYAKSFKVLKKGGMIVSMLEQDKENLSEKYGAVAISQFTQVNTEHLNMLTKLIEDKVVRIYIDKIYTLDRVREAFEEKQNEDVKGKIVIEIHPG
jgi:NADPH:quinone reductase-like Zn-dependent oxidoreductase